MIFFIIFEIVSTSNVDICCTLYLNSAPLSSTFLKYSHVSEWTCKSLVGPSILGTCWGQTKVTITMFIMMGRTWRIISVKQFCLLISPIELSFRYHATHLSLQRSHALPCRHDKVIFPRDKMFKVGDLRSKWAELLFEMSA